MPLSEEVLRLSILPYDEATAILVGDALNSEAFYRISKAPLRDDI